MRSYLADHGQLDTVAHVLLVSYDSLVFDSVLIRKQALMPDMYLIVLLLNDTKISAQVR
jgi:hypothetical protein